MLSFDRLPLYLILTAIIIFLLSFGVLPFINTIKVNVSAIADSSTPSNVYIPAPDRQTTIATRYYREYALKSDAEKTAYDKIEDTLRNMRHSTSFDDTLSLRNAIDIYKAVLDDNPDIFWAPSDAEYIEDHSNVTGILLDYTYTPEEVVRLASEHERVAQQILDDIHAQIGSDFSPRDILVSAHDWIASNTIYATDADHAQTISGVFDDRTAVCSGYSRALKYLCDIEGIPCIYVRGHANGDFGKPHAWNMAQVDDAILYVDITWDQAEPAQTGNVSHLWITEDMASFQKGHWTGYNGENEKAFAN